MSKLRKGISRHRLFLASLGYFLLIALLRSSPYWSFGIELSWQSGAAIALMPLLPGLFRRNGNWVFRGLLISVLTPFQSGVIAACFIATVFFITRFVFRRSITDRAYGGMKPLFAGVAAYAAFVLCHWASAWGGVHTAYSTLYAAITQFLAPACAGIIALYWSANAGDDPLDPLYKILIAQAVTLLAYPMLIGQPALLASIVNGVLKPLYTLLDWPWTYPWYDPDWNPGSLSIVNYAGIVMMAAAMLALLRYSARKRSVDLLLAVAMLALGLVAENTIAVGAAVWAFASAAVIVLFLRLTSRVLTLRTRAAMFMALAAAGVVALTSVVYLGGRYSGTQKANYYRQALTRVSESPARLLLGYGAGAYGSRAAILRIDSDAYPMRSNYEQSYARMDFNKMFPPNDFVEDYHVISELPADWVNSSQGLIYSGIIPLALENGALGCALLCFIFWPGARSIARQLADMDRRSWPLTGMAIFCPIFLGCLAVFYNYPEIPTIAFLLLLPIFIVTGNELKRTVVLTK